MKLACGAFVAEVAAFTLASTLRSPAAASFSSPSVASAPLISTALVFCTRIAAAETTGIDSAEPQLRKFLNPDWSPTLRSEYASLSRVSPCTPVTSAFSPTVTRASADISTYSIVPVSIGTNPLWIVSSAFPMKLVEWSTILKARASAVRFPSARTVPKSSTEAETSRPSPLLDLKRIGSSASGFTAPLPA